MDRFKIGFFRFELRIARSGLCSKWYGGLLRRKCTKVYVGH